MNGRVVGAIIAIVLAVVGTSVLISYIRAVENRVAAGERLVDVVVAQERVEVGTDADALGDRVAVEQWPARLVLPDSVAKPDDLAGLVVVADLFAGEQVLRTRFADPAELPDPGFVIPPAMIEVTVSLDQQRTLGGVLVPGETVAVFISMSRGNAEGDAEGVDGDQPDADPEPVPTTHLVLHKVLVTRVQYDSSDAAAAVSEQDVRHAPGGRVMVTFAAMPDDAERLVFAAEHASLWLGRQSSDSAESGTQIQTPETIYR